MPTYRYHCPECGEFPVSMPMTSVTPSVDCPDCRSVSRRVFGQPSLRTLDGGLRRSLDAAASSADAPPVVSSIPGRPRRRPTPITRDPRHARLPRP
ncbi:FmdB family zinc ribbon protein [Mycobacterium shigaense]|uniref:FmdB family zinc ribbon protein n=1 Tax=Mycobacterium shigaense TaxID=722731 RepID=UPI000E570BE4